MKRVLLAMAVIVTASGCNDSLISSGQPTVGDVVGKSQFEIDAMKLEREIELLKKKSPTLDNMERYRRLSERLALLKEHINTTNEDIKAGEAALAESNRIKREMDYVANPPRGGMESPVFWNK